MGANLVYKGEQFHKWVFRSFFVLATFQFPRLKFFIIFQASVACNILVQIY